MKKVFGYIRVSDKKQEDGASLSEQKRTISEYAQKHNLQMVKWFSEVRTASRTGRPEFVKMMMSLKNGEAQGVVIHKIDRSARNLHDWASIGDLIDNEINVYFAHESLNLNERGGRLSADIQAVMASDYVRNLRQETLKGLYGRLKQGIYPFGAPIGYLNNGKGKVKTVDSSKAPLIRKLFELYVTERYNVRTLAMEMEKRGLTNSKGRRVCKNGISKILKNPFYIGLMQVKGKIFEGRHEPIIENRLFRQAELIMSGRITSNGLKHDYIFRKKLKCSHCGYVMPGEMQKGRVYYRCQTKGCLTKCVREDVVEQYVRNSLKCIELSTYELDMIKEAIQLEEVNASVIQREQIKGLQLQLDNLKFKEQRLLSAYLDNLLSKEEYQEQKKVVLREVVSLKEHKSTIEASERIFFIEMQNFLELCKTPIKLYDSAIPEEKRVLVDTLTSNITVDRKRVGLSIVSPYRELAYRDLLTSCPLDRDGTRKLPIQNVYTDTNTSGVQVAPLSKKRILKLIEVLRRMFVEKENWKPPPI